MRKSTPAKDRFWAKVKKTAGCWLWMGAPHRNGYGSIYVDGISIYVHRYSFMLHNGTILNGLDVLHTCDNPLCVNPDHLWTGTQADNMTDKEKKGRGNHPKGENSGRSKLSAAQVQGIRDAHETHSVTQAVIAKRYGISQVQVSNILSGKQWNSE